jgi:hypothetical protein
MPETLALTCEAQRTGGEEKKLFHRPPRPPVERLGAGLLERAGAEYLGVEVDLEGFVYVRPWLERLGCS